MVNIRERQHAHMIRQTQRLIDAEGSYIALRRPPEPVPDGAGSLVRPDVPDTRLPAVRRALMGITMVGRGVNQQPERWIVTGLGKRYKKILVMIGMPDDNIQAEDWWTDDEGERNEVIFVHEDRSYQTKAEVIIVATG